MKKAYIVEMIKSKLEFKSLKKEWNMLLSSSRNNNFFLTWEWLYTWWEVFGGHHKLCILLCKDSFGKVQGIFPLYIKKKKVFRLFSLHELRFIGSDALVPSEYLDCFCCPGLEKRIISEFINYLVSNKSLWNVTCLTDIDQKSENIKKLIQDLSVKRINYSVKEQRPFCPVIKFGEKDGWEIFLKSIDKSLRQNIRRWQKKVEKNFQVDFSNYNTLNPIDGLFTKFIELHGLRRKDKGGLSKFDSTDYLRFHKTLIPLISQNNWLHFSVLRLNSTVVATKYNFQYNNKVYSYQGGWDPQFAKYNIGQVLFSYILKNSINNNIDEIDLLRGEEPYKIYWANEIKKKCSIFLVSNSKLGNGLVMYSKIKNSLKQMICPQRIKDKLVGHS